MGVELDNNVKRASQLYREATIAGLDRVCAEFSLSLLGANIDFQSLEDGEYRYNYPTSYFERHGLFIDSYSHLSYPVTDDDIHSTLSDQKSGRIAYTMAGYLCFSLSSHSGVIPHVYAVLPRAQLPRDSRRYAKKTHTYCVIDSAQDRIIRFATSHELAELANSEIEKGYFIIFQKIVRRKR